MQKRSGNAAVRLLAVCMLVVTLPILGHGAAAQEVDFAVEPAEGSSLAETGGYFLVEAEPGDRVKQAVILRSGSQERVNLELTAVDAVTGVYGGASYDVPGDEPAATGAWITLEETEVQLDAGESQTVSFRIEVPDDARSGEHLAGLSVWAREDEGGGPNEDDAVGIDVRSRRVMAVQVNLPGSSDPELVIGGVEPAARPDGLYLEIDIENVGFGLTKGEGIIELPDDGFRQEFDLDTFVPGTSIAYPLKWMDSPQEGEYAGIVEITYDDGEKVASWEGTFVVGDPVLDELEDRGAATTRGTAGWVIPAVGAMAALLVLAGAAWFLRARGGSGRGRSPAPAASQPPTEKRPPGVPPPPPPPS